MVGESLLTGWEAKSELGVLPDGGIVSVSDRPLPKVLQLVEYNDFDQRLTFFSVDGEAGSPVLPVPATMVSRLRREKTIIIYSLFPDHEPIGYRVPMTQH